jgi:hypothetical protein
MGKGVKVITNKTAEEENDALTKTFQIMVQINYYNIWGPNSNTFARQLLSNAGFPTLKPPGAIGWGYDGIYDYGGPLYDKNGKPLIPEDEAIDPKDLKALKELGKKQTNQEKLLRKFPELLGPGFPNPPRP